MHSLNIVPARSYPRATDHIDDIVEMIEGLVQKGNAYEDQGSYYFEVDRLELLISGTQESQSICY